MKPTAVILSGSDEPNVGAGRAAEIREFVPHVCTAFARRAKTLGARTRKLRLSPLISGGEGGIRTHGTREGSTVFETARFNRSRTSPYRVLFSFPQLALAVTMPDSIVAAAVDRVLLNSPPANEILIPDSRTFNRSSSNV
jgi:hypothetical protein